MLTNTTSISLCCCCRDLMKIFFFSHSFSLPKQSSQRCARDFAPGKCPWTIFCWYAFTLPPIKQLLSLNKWQQWHPRNNLDTPLYVKTDDKKRNRLNIYFQTAKTLGRMLKWQRREECSAPLWIRAASVLFSSVFNLSAWLSRWEEAQPSGARLRITITSENRSASHSQIFMKDSWRSDSCLTRVILFLYQVFHLLI